MTLKQYKKAIEQTNIVSKTDVDGVITFVNDEFCEISGYSRDELIGANHNIIRHPDVSRDVFVYLWESIKAKKTHVVTVKNRAKDGTAFYVNTTVIPMLNRAGDIEEFMAIRSDATKSIVLTEKLKQKEEELERLNATLKSRVKKQTSKLIKLNKTLEMRIKKEVKRNRSRDQSIFEQSHLAGMGEMIGSIAHQWRQPLSELGIILYKMKKIHHKHYKGDEVTYDKSYDGAKKVIKKMSDTIDDFRNFFNPHRPSEIFSLKDALDDTMLVMKETLKYHKIELKVDIKDELSIEGSISEFSQVLINLLNNSKDAFNQKSIAKRVINIKIKRVDKSYAMITFQDSAGGIKKSLMSKIFEPYFTTKHASVGTGLGLYMSRIIVQNSMRGVIEAKNLLGGVCFFIKVPLCHNRERKDG